jgi:Short C-terminal domain
MMRRFGRPGLLGTVARTAVIAGTATEVSGAVRNHNEQRAMQQEQAAQVPEPAPQPAAAQPAGGVQDTIEQLKELASLKDQGILSEAEFESQKAKLLGG